MTDTHEEILTGMDGSQKAGHYQAILFDLDGTLLLPAIDFKLLRQRLGLPDKMDILEHVQQQDEAQRCRLSEIILAAELEAANRASLMPGASATLEWISTHEIRLGILTRNCIQAWELSRERCGLRPEIDVFTRELTPTKPNPLCLQPILRKWSLQAEQIIHVGDYLYDLQLASQTGMYSILIHSSGENPFSEPCHFVARDHFHLLEHLTLIFSDGSLAHPCYKDAMECVPPGYQE
jgi:HAD superfamily hydrolase (TIGR01509 family)